jgi:hypothetical protein
MLGIAADLERNELSPHSLMRTSWTVPQRRDGVDVATRSSDLERHSSGMMSKKSVLQ